eukprot:snap_masked-scaffold_5-processed-gene-20.63-mRNA-1 protein AED:1.00 eAED:1.00 QI:0/0/0/0/1/1/2/0/63
MKCARFIEELLEEDRRTLDNKGLFIAYNSKSSRVSLLMDCLHFNHIIFISELAGVIIVLEKNL